MARDGDVEQLGSTRTSSYPRSSLLSNVVDGAANQGGDGIRVAFLVIERILLGCVAAEPKPHHQGHEKQHACKDNERLQVLGFVVI